MELHWPVANGETKISQLFGGNPDGYPDYYAKKSGMKMNKIRRY